MVIGGRHGQRRRSIRARLAGRLWRQPGRVQQLHRRFARRPGHRADRLAIRHLDLDQRRPNVLALERVPGRPASRLAHAVLRPRDPRAVRSSSARTAAWPAVQMSAPHSPAPGTGPLANLQFASGPCRNAYGPDHQPLHGRACCSRAAGQRGGLGIRQQPGARSAEVTAPRL